MDAEVRERFERIEENMDRVEANNRETSELVKKLAAAQVRTEELLNTLLDALIRGRGNGHGRQPE